MTFKFLCLAGAFGSTEVCQLSVEFELHVAHLNTTEIQGAAWYVFLPALNIFTDGSEAPLLNQLEGDGTASFHFIHGLHEATPPPGYEDFFGGPPFFRFLEETKDPNGVDGLERIRDFPAGASPEDTIRLFNPLGDSEGLAITAQQALDYVVGVVKEHGPFDGIVGYSEGALVAGTLVLKEEELRKNDPEYKNQIKMGMFFGGWPPLRPDLKRFVLADETDLQMEIATCHVSE